MSISQVLSNHNARMSVFLHFAQLMQIKSSSVTGEDLVVSHRFTVSFQRLKGIQNAYMDLEDPMQELDT